MDHNEFAVALDLYKSATGWVTTYWNFFSAVSLALVGLIFGGKAVLGGRGKLAVAMVYAVLAGSNNLALGHALETRAAAKRVLIGAVGTSDRPAAALSRGYVTLIEQLDTPPPVRVRLFQIALSLAVLLGIYVQHRYERRKAGTTMQEHRLRLRSGTEAVMTLPDDLTAGESERIASFTRTIPTGEAAARGRPSG